MKLPPIERLYLIGSLRDNAVRALANRIRKLGITVFDDWHAAGSRADDIWQEYEQGRGHKFKEGLAGEHARDVHKIDVEKIDKSDTGLLLMPTGKSCHMEFGYMMGQGKRGYILMPGEPERWDIMYRFATDLFTTEKDLMKELKRNVK
jgi:hypothetical protein